MRDTTLPPSVRNQRREPMRAVFLAILLGLAAGFVHGWNLSLLALLLMVVFFNLRARLFLAIWALGVVLSWLLVPLSYGVGRFVLDSTPVGALLGLFNDTPVVAMLAWDRYAVVGGIIVALALSVPAFITIRGWIIALRGRRAAQWHQQHAGHLQTLVDAPRPERRRDRVGYWLFVEDARDHGELVATTPLIRPLGLWGLLVGIGLASVAVWWFAPKHAYSQLLKELTDANRAQIDVGNAEFDLWSGRITLSNLALADPEELTEDRLRIANVVADFNWVSLLQGRLEIDRLRMGGIDCHVLRECLAHQAGLRAAALDIETDAGPSRFSVSNSDASDLSLSNYVRDWSWIEDHLHELDQFCAFLESLGKYERFQPSFAKGRHATLSQFWQARSNLGWPRPTLLVRSATVEKLPANWDLGDKSTLNLADVNSSANVCPRPMRVEIDAPERLFKFRAALDLRQDPYRREVEVETRAMAIIDHLTPASSKQRIVCEGGTVLLRAAGWMLHDEFDLTCHVEADDLALRLAGDRLVAGVPPHIWNESLDYLRELRLTATLRGHVSDPRLQIDAPELIRHLERRLRAGGASRLAAAISEPLGPATAEVSAAVEEARAILPPHVAAESGPIAELKPPIIEGIEEVAALAVAAAPVVELPADDRPLNSSERIHRLPPIPLPVVIGPTAPTAPPVSLAVAPPAQPASTAPVAEDCVCQTQLPPVVESVQPDLPETTPTEPIATNPAPTPDAWAAAPATDLQNQAVAVNGLPPTSANPPGYDMLPADLYETPGETQPRPGFGEWTRNLFGRMRNAWPWKPKDKAPEDPFDPAGAESNSADQYVGATAPGPENTDRAGSQVTRRVKLGNPFVR